MSTITSGSQHAPLAEEGSNGLLYALGGSMIAMTIIVCVLIVEGSLLWLIVAFVSLVVTLGLVAAFILNFIGETDH